MEYSYVNRLYPMEYVDEMPKCMLRQRLLAVIMHSFPRFVKIVSLYDRMNQQTHKTSSPGLQNAFDKGLNTYPTHICLVSVRFVIPPTSFVACTSHP